MPTVSRIGPYRFYFYSHEPNEPPHVHVDRDDLSAKFWLQPVGLARNFGFPPKELRRLQKLGSPPLLLISMVSAIRSDPALVGESAQS